MSRYVGSTWRSRFLRAPKVALDLATRTDFVPLGELATASLGLKTGDDDFFYLRQVTLPPDGADRRIVAPSGTTFVEGLQGWRGSISSRDLLPALLNPHQLFRTDGSRCFVVPKDLATRYLSPADLRPRADLGGYIATGERAGVNRKPLVLANASVQRWYRQARGIVRTRWALPYNSAYDYGAWDNSGGAVLNGRFVAWIPSMAWIRSYSARCSTARSRS